MQASYKKKFKKKPLPNPPNRDERVADTVFLLVDYLKTSKSSWLPSEIHSDPEPPKSPNFGDVTGADGQAVLQGAVQLNPSESFWTVSTTCWGHFGQNFSTSFARQALIKS